MWIPYNILIDEIDEIQFLLNLQHYFEKLNYVVFYIIIIIKIIILWNISDFINFHVFLCMFL